MTQHSGIQVLPAAERIDQRAVPRLSHGVDGQIAACEILFQSDVGAEFDGEPAIARRHLALEPRQRVLLVGLGVQKHGKIAADFAKVTAQQLLTGPADDDPVPLLDGKPEQGVPNRSANQIHLHA
jgi:hypothetical protein